MFDQILDGIALTLTPMLPMFAAAATSALIAFARNQVNALMPPWTIPIVLPIAGGVVAGLAQAVGFDIGDFNPQTASLDGWQTVIAGTMTGGFAVALHQIVTQFKNRKNPPLLNTSG